MNANSQFTLNGQQLSEEEFVDATLLSCYLAYVVLNEWSLKDMDIDICENNIKVIRQHLAKLEGLKLSDVQQMNVAHYDRFCQHYEEEIHYRQQEDRRVKVFFCLVLCCILVVIGMYLLLRG